MSDEVVKDDAYYHEEAVKASAAFARKARRVDMSKQEYKPQPRYSYLEDNKRTESEEIEGSHEEALRASARFNAKASCIDMSKQVHHPEESGSTKLEKIARNYNESLRNVNSNRSPTRRDVSLVARVDGHFKRGRGLSRLEELEAERTERFNKLYNKMYNS